jgi:hypothetical protein
MLTPQGRPPELTQKRPSPPNRPPPLEDKLAFGGDHMLEKRAFPKLAKLGFCFRDFGRVTSKAEVMKWRGHI